MARKRTFKVTGNKYWINGKITPVTGIYHTDRPNNKKKAIEEVTKSLTRHRYTFRDAIAVEVCPETKEEIDGKNRLKIYA